MMKGQNVVYDRMIKLVTENELFTKGQTFNASQFKQALSSKMLLETFNHIYMIDAHCSGVWTMWDFADRFQRFAKALCTVGYCEKIGNGRYIKK